MQFKSMALAAMVMMGATAAQGQTVYDATTEMAANEYAIERVNPRATQLIRALSPCCYGKLLPAEQFENLERPYRNPGVWGNNPYTIMRKVDDADGDPNYYEMKQMMQEKQETPAAKEKAQEPSPRAIIKIPLLPEGKPINPDADQGRVIIRPWKAGTQTKSPTA